MPSLTTKIQSLISHTLERSAILKIPMYGYGKTNQGYKLVNRAPSTELKNVINQLSNDPAINRVLDLGSGDGVLEFNSRMRKYSYTAIDIEEAAIHALQSIFKNQPSSGKDTAIIGDITQLSSVPELNSKQFDAAILWRVLHGVSPRHYKHIFHNIYNLLSSPASFYIAVACDQDWKAAAMEGETEQDGMSDCADIMFRQYNKERIAPFNIHFFTQDELKALGTTAGFKLKEMHIFQEPSGYSHLQDKKNTYIFAHFTK